MDIIACGNEFAATNDSADEVSNLKEEVENYKAAALMLQQGKNDEVAGVKEKYDNEIASLQRILKETVADTMRSGEHERLRLIREKESVESQLRDLKRQFSLGGGGSSSSGSVNETGLFNSMMKSLKAQSPSESSLHSDALDDVSASRDAARQSSVPGPGGAPQLNASSPSQMTSSLYDSMQHEISFTRQQLSRCERRAKAAEKKASILESKLLSVDSNETDDVPGIHDGLKDKSKGDLQILVTVLSTQKQVLQEDMMSFKQRISHLAGQLAEASQEVASCHDVGATVLESLKYDFPDSTTVAPSDLPKSMLLEDEISKIISEIDQDQPDFSLSPKLEHSTPTPAQSNQPCSSNVQYLQNVQSLIKKTESLNRSLQEVTEKYGQIYQSVMNECLMVQTPDDSVHAVGVPLFHLDSLDTSANDETLTYERKRSMSLGEDSATTPPTTLNLSSLAGQNNLVASEINDSKKSLSHGHLSPEPSTLKSQSWAATPVPLEKSGVSSSSQADFCLSPSDNSLATSPEVSKYETGESTSTCEMCSNYEHKLQQAQEVERQLQTELTTTKNSSEKYRIELDRQKQNRIDGESRQDSLLERLQSKASNFDQMYSEKVFEERLAEVQVTYDECISTVRAEINSLDEEYRNVREKLDKAETSYDHLLGRHRKQAAEMRDEAIDLPQDVDELQLHAIQLREELIETRATKEHIEESRRSEVSFLKSQLDSIQFDYKQMEDSLTHEIKSLRVELSQTRKTLEKLREFEHLLSQEQSKCVDLQQQVSGFRESEKSLGQKSVKVDSQVKEFKQRIQSLQTELDNSEAVQRDFVRLSQSLQVELEKIRQAEHEVRWQHEEDIVICNQCKQPFNKQRRKLHCWHCGKIFCQTCLVRTVASGPAQRPSPVCDVCHTIVQRDTAPYFATQAPSS